jgi:hypothetical protein
VHLTAHPRKRLNSTENVWKSSTRSGDVRLSEISARVIEGFQAQRRVEGASNRTVNMDVLKRFKQRRRLEDDAKMLTESGGDPT